MAGKQKYKPEKVQSPRAADFQQKFDYDYTSPYPCCVCGQTFTSRYELATHKHGKKD